MPRNINKGSSLGSSSHTAKEIKERYEKNQTNFEKYEVAKDMLKQLRDVTKSANRNISIFDKGRLRSYMENIGAQEINLRNVSRYLAYRSHIYFRLIEFYQGMPDLRCRKVVPKYDLTAKSKSKSILKDYNDTLDFLDIMNLHGNSKSIWTRCLIDDVCYAIWFHDETGQFFYILDPDYCKIDSRYMTGDFGFAMNMTYWRGTTRQKELEWLGEPFTSMWKEYERTNEKWVHVPDEYGACFKFRADDWQTVVPPFISLFISLINLEDLADIQAIADEQQIYKLIYYPMKVLSGAKDSDDFQVTPDLAIEYFDRMLDEALPPYVAGAVIPGDELGVIDFEDNASKDNNRIEESQTAILNTQGGGMVLNTSKITTQAGFEAALKVETEFALSSLLPQINGFANRMLKYSLGDNACKVEHFEVSVYTKDNFRKAMLESNQYGFSNKLAYNTLLGISEKDTIAMNYLEEEVLKLHDIMKYPLSSSFTQQNKSTDNNNTVGRGRVGQGRPLSDDGDLSDSGSAQRSRGIG